MHRRFTFKQVDTACLPGEQRTRLAPCLLDWPQILWPGWNRAGKPHSDFEPNPWMKQMRKATLWSWAKKISYTYPLIKSKQLETVPCCLGPSLAFHFPSAHLQDRPPALECMVTTVSWLSRENCKSRSTPKLHTCSCRRNSTPFKAGRWPRTCNERYH